MHISSALAHRIQLHSACQLGPSAEPLAQPGAAQPAPQPVAQATRPAAALPTATPAALQAQAGPATIGGGDVPGAGPVGQATQGANGLAAGSAVSLDDKNDGFFARLFGLQASVKLSAPDAPSLEMRPGKYGGIEVKNLEGEWLVLSESPVLQVQLRDGTTVQLGSASLDPKSDKKAIALAVASSGGTTTKVIAGDRKNDAAQQTGLSSSQMTELLNSLAIAGVTTPDARGSYLPGLGPVK
jgi:hypothetical protein